MPRRSPEQIAALIGTFVDHYILKGSEWMVVGEGPGVDEAERGEPFVGMTGQEMRRWFNGNELPSFDEVSRANLYRIFGGKDYDFTDDDLARDEPILLAGLRKVQPTVIVAVGRHSSRYFLGDISMDEVHGLGWYLPETSPAAKAFRNPTSVVVFCCYHPAAGFRSPELSALVSFDFTQLALFADGKLEPRKLHDDPIPNPQYFHVTSTAPIDTFKALKVKELCEDSEGYLHRPWSLQFASRPGTGYLIRATEPALVGAYLDYLVDGRVRATFHSALHDRGIRRVFARLCGWSEERILFELDTLPFDDTMVMAYLLQLEPRGLKGLATRHANMAMQSFDEVMGDAQYKLAMGYLQSMWDCCNFDYEIAQQEKMDEINTTPLRNKDGSIKKLAKTGETRYRKITKVPTLPKSDLFKAAERCMRSKHPAKLWADQREDIRDAGYRSLGAMPEASLSHVKFPVALRYGCRDADGTGRVKPELSSRMDALGLRGVYNLELGTYPLIDRMMAVGMRPDLKVFSRLSSTLACELADIQMRLEEQTGIEGFNANSGDQVAAYLFGTLGLPVIKMTPAGDRESTNDKILEALEKEHGIEYPVIFDCRNFREQYKLKNTFVDRLPDFVHRYPYDGRIHTTFRTTTVITGRLAASDPNVLALPEHGKFAKAFKAGWVAEDGHVVCNWDLSQVELRVLAHLSRDPVLVEAYLYECPHHNDWQSGKAFCKRDACILKGDLHARLAHMVFGLQPSAQDDSKHRLPAKTHNFGLAMGMTCYGLMIELRKNGVEVDEDGAQEWIDASNKLYKKVPHYKDEKTAEARRNGLVRCLSGRIRYIGGIRSRDERLRAEAERFAFSTPIQEGATWIAKHAQILMWDQVFHHYYRQGYYKGGSKGQWVEPLCWVHDALKAEVPEHLAQEVHERIVPCMTTQINHLISVPIGVEGKFGSSFAEMRKFGRTA